MDKLKWLETSGGPFILGSKSDVAKWRGIEGSSGFGFGNDYEASCSIEMEIAALPGEIYNVLVIGDEPDRLCVIQPKPDMFLILRWKYAEDEHAITNSMETVFGPETNWGDQFDFEFGDGSISVMDASRSGATSDHSFEFATKRGVYEVATAYVTPNDKTAYLCHKFEKVSRMAS